MILGADHIALSARDLDRAAAVLSGWGIPPEFVEKNLPNAAAKAPLLREYRRLHGIAFCRPRRGIAIEIVEHGAYLGHSAPGAATYEVLLEGTPSRAEPVTTRAGDGAVTPTPAPNAAFERALREGAKANEPFAARAPELDLRFWCAGPAREGQAPAVSALLLPVANLDAAIRFWTEGVGARRESAGNGWAKVAWSPPVAAWAAEIVLFAGANPAAPPPLLDDAGFPCLALLANRLDEDRARACQAGGQEVCPPFRLTVHGRPLDVCILRGPSGELVELLDVRPNPARHVALARTEEGDR